MNKAIDDSIDLQKKIEDLKSALSNEKENFKECQEKLDMTEGKCCHQ